MTPPSMPCGNDSSGITTFTRMMLSRDQIFLWIGFHFDVYGSIKNEGGFDYRNNWRFFFMLFEVEEFLDQNEQDIKAYAFCNFPQRQESPIIPKPVENSQLSKNIA